MNRPWLKMPYEDKLTKCSERDYYHLLSLLDSISGSESWQISRSARPEKEYMSISLGGAVAIGLALALIVVTSLKFIIL